MLLWRSLGQLWAVSAVGQTRGQIMLIKPIEIDTNVSTPHIISLSCITIVYSIVVGVDSDRSHHSPLGR